MFFLVGVVELQKEVELVDVAPASPGALQSPGKVESVKKKHNLPLIEQKKLFLLALAN